MNGKLIPNEELKNLTIGTKLLIHCIDEDCWFPCMLQTNVIGPHLLDDSIAGKIVAYLDDLDFLEVYEFNQEDIERLVKKNISSNTIKNQTRENSQIVQIPLDVQDEINRAVSVESFNSQHEGYAVILEEVEELWSHVKAKPTLRSKEVMREKAIQIAAMAVRFIIDFC